MRQREGIELAKKEGKFKGRLKKYHKNHAGMKYAVKLYKEGYRKETNSLSWFYQKVYFLIPTFLGMKCRQLLSILF